MIGLTRAGAGTAAAAARAGPLTEAEWGPAARARPAADLAGKASAGKPTGTGPCQ